MECVCVWGGVVAGATFFQAAGAQKQYRTNEWKHLKCILICVNEVKKKSYVISKVITIILSSPYGSLLQLET